MSKNYRTHLEDKMAHALRTTLWQLYSAPNVQAPIKQVIYRTWRNGKRLYEITGYGRHIEIEAVPDSAMEECLINLKNSPNTKALDLLVATLEAQS